LLEVVLSGIRRSGDCPAPALRCHESDFVQRPFIRAVNTVSLLLFNNTKF